MLNYQRQAWLHEKCICVFEERASTSTDLHSYCSSTDSSPCGRQVCLWEKADVCREESICLRALLLSTLQLSLLSLLPGFSKTFLLSAFPALGLLLPTFHFTLRCFSLVALPSFPCPLPNPPAPMANGYLFSAAPSLQATSRGSSRLGSYHSRTGRAQETLELRGSCYRVEKCSQPSAKGSSWAVKSKLRFL